MEQLFLTILNRAVTAGWLVLLVMVLRVVLKKSAPGGALWPVSHCGGAAAVAGGPAAPGRRQPGAHHGAYLRRRADGGGNSGIRRASRRRQSRRCGGSGDGGRTGQSLSHIAAVVWLVGMAAMALYLAGSYVRLRVRLRTAVRLEDGVWESELALSPFVLGFVRPASICPSAWTGEAGTMCYHERTHIRHRTTG